MPRPVRSPIPPQVPIATLPWCPHKIVSRCADNWHQILRYDELKKKRIEHIIDNSHKLENAISECVALHIQPLDSQSWALMISRQICHADSPNEFPFHVPLSLPLKYLRMFPLEDPWQHVRTVPFRVSINVTTKGLFKFRFKASFEI